MRNRKHTAWKKNRKLGDVYGGRKHPKITDRIFHCAHSLSPPGPHQETPILIQDNPSSDYFFPHTAEECRDAIAALPKRDHSGVTHLWLRRPSATDRRRGLPLAEFICGRGVRLITMYPWRKDMRLCLGRNKPPGKVANEYTRFGAPPFKQGGWWYVEFAMADLRRFWVHVLYHEVGHHVDWYDRHWSKANTKKQEEFADQYAMNFTKTGTHVLNRLNKK